MPPATQLLRTPLSAHTTHHRTVALPPRRKQVVGFIVLVLGVYVLTATKDSRPGCAAGTQAVLGRTLSMSSTPEYKALAVCDIEVPVCDIGGAARL